MKSKNRYVKSGLVSSVEFNLQLKTLKAHSDVLSWKHVSAVEGCCAEN